MHFDRPHKKAIIIKKQTKLKNVKLQQRPRKRRRRRR